MKDAKGNEIRPGDFVCWRNDYPGEPWSDNPAAPEPSGDIGLVFASPSGVLCVEVMISRCDSEVRRCHEIVELGESEDMEVIGNLVANPDFITPNLGVWKPYEDMLNGEARL